MDRELSEIDYPKTANEWWMLVDANWDNLSRLFNQFHPTSVSDNSGFAITAAAAEQACEDVRKSVRNRPTPDINKMKLDRDPELCSVFNQVWFGAPESRSVMSVPGFGLLCDLCSEGYVLEEGCDLS